ncbi:hypothetical protein TTHERM_000011528 (macronuclear) [Tetrahymena thermophila SB210]|uniref:Uncharacterized protein n=1 Tax=Tetrahymena thermophila (strain SB210) TaxID=312017 RepID=W7XKA6_TETTS|nr:hypothetical protein TTHERM_000011528 [Tetrahymena thermophila SB210]EWS76336.1 hypothetical protein TTHERM_000011528 [Tetrahymena thermophila SB210]|eukprot:XP_012651120.1 hypothetical protein TTHERM_000011528 [Tetrahymena thermophila SB210]
MNLLEIYTDKQVRKLIEQIKIIQIICCFSFEDNHSQIFKDLYSSKPQKK